MGQVADYDGRDKQKSSREVNAIMIDVPIPMKLNHRPKYKGLPIPFIVQYYRGVPDFRVTDPNKWQTCVEEKRCGLCGLKHESGRPLFFIGGSISHETRLFTDPPMHFECARYAMKVCPFLYLKDKTYVVDRPGDEDKPRETNELMHDKTRMGLFKAASCWAIEARYESGRKPHKLIQASPWISVEWFDEIEGHYGRE